MRVYPIDFTTDFTYQVWEHVKETPNLQESGCIQTTANRQVWNRTKALPRYANNYLTLRR